MDGAGSVNAAKGGAAPAKPGRPIKADDFKRVLALATEAPGQPTALPPRPLSRPASPPGPVLDTTFRARIARAESGALGPGEGYGARNATSGALGRYQLTPQALRDLGWKDASGGWTALAAGHGVDSDGGFLANPAAQEAAMGAYLRRAEVLLDRNGSLARSGGTVMGLHGASVALTEAGLVAAAHRRGAASVARYLAHRAAPSDAPLSVTERKAFVAIERRLREFAELPYAVAARQARGAPAA